MKRQNGRIECGNGIVNVSREDKTNTPRWREEQWAGDRSRGRQVEGVEGGEGNERAEKNGD